MSFKTSTFTWEINGQPSQIVYSEWGAKSAFPLVCIHGLTGNGHDFDVLAPHLVKAGYRVIAIDLPGRGRSDFLEQPQFYTYSTYLSVIEGVLGSLGIKILDWLGVSLGGLLGMRAAAEQGFAIRRLLLNDIGPEVPRAALDYIYQVVGVTYEFPSVADLEQRLRETRGLTWGPVSHEQWQAMAHHNARRLANGRYSYAYDPKIADMFAVQPLGDKNMWQCWEAMRCDICVLQGEKSALLTRDILEKMRQCGPRFDLHVFADCGHVPSLMAPSQIRCVLDWLRSDT